MYHVTYLPILAIVLLLFILRLPNEALVLGTIMTIGLLKVYYFLKKVEEKDPVKIRLFELCILWRKAGQDY